MHYVCALALWHNLRIEVRKHSIMIIRLFLVVIATSLLASCSYTRIADLTVVANRNVGSTDQYEMIQRDVRHTAKAKRNSLDVAVDKAVAQVEGGEYLQNVKIYVKSNGKKIRVVGDVWGIPEPTTGITTSVSGDNDLSVGDKVAFKVAGLMTEGRIVGVNSSGAIVEINSKIGVSRKKQVPIEKLTKISKEVTTARN